MPLVRIWNGTAWVDKTDKPDFAYWNGTAWTEPSDVRTWNGASWESVFNTAPGLGIELRTASSNTATSASSLGVNIPGSVQPGDFMILTVAQTTNAPTVFDDISGWTKQGEQRAGSASFTMAIYTRIAQAGDEGGSVTSTSVNSAHYSGQLRVYSGVHQTTPLDTAVVLTQLDAASFSASAPAITVATTNAMLVALYGIPTVTGTTLTASDWTDPSGFTNELVTCPASGSGNRPCIALYNRIAPSTGSQGPFEATVTQDRRWSLATMALRPA